MNKTQTIQYCKSLLRKPFGYILDDEEKNIILRLLNNHSEKEKKIGCGIDYISLKKGLYNTPAFWITRIDGTTTDFSYRKCLNRPTQKSQFKEACREAIRGDIEDYLIEKQNGGKFICEKSGETFNREGIHVDHCGDYPFSIIMENFIKEYRIDVNKIKFNETKNGCMHTWFVDKEIENNFRSFHKKYAKLRILSKKIHINITKRKPLTMTITHARKILKFILTFFNAKVSEVKFERCVWKLANEFNVDET